MVCFDTQRGTGKPTTKMASFPFGTVAKLDTKGLGRDAFNMETVKDLHHTPVESPGTSCWQTDRPCLCPDGTASQAGHIERHPFWFSIPDCKVPKIERSFTRFKHAISPISSMPLLSNQVEKHANSSEGSESTKKRIRPPSFRQESTQNTDKKPTL